jgi:predicted DNA-binding transcriptional regulator AlpA
MIADKQLLDVKQLAEWLAVSPAWVRDHAMRKQPRLPVVRLGKLLRFRAEDIEEFVRTCQTTGRAA